MVRVGSQKYKTMLKICYFHIYIYTFKPNLAKSSIKSSPLWLHHKIDPKKEKEKTMCNSNRASWFLFRSTSLTSTQDPPIHRRGPGRHGHQESRRTVVARALQSFSVFSSAAWSPFLPILSLSLSLSHVMTLNQ